MNIWSGDVSLLSHLTSSYHKFPNENRKLPNLLSHELVVFYFCFKDLQSCKCSSFANLCSTGKSIVADIVQHVKFSL